MNMRDFWAKEAEMMRDKSHWGIGVSENRDEEINQTLCGSIYRCNDDGSLRLYKKLPTPKNIEHTYVITGTIRADFDKNFETAKVKYDTMHPDVFLLPKFAIRQEIAAAMTERSNPIKFELGGMIYRVQDRTRKYETFHIRASNGNEPTSANPVPVVDIRQRYETDIYAKRWKEIAQLLGSQEFSKVKNDRGESNLDRFAVHTWHSHPDFYAGQQPPSPTDVTFAGSSDFTDNNASHYVLLKRPQGTGIVYLYRNKSPRFYDTEADKAKGWSIGYADGFIQMKDFYTQR